jgi:pSer/pThr/pTyr-binding forkhead associated (FHA) protein
MASSNDDGNGDDSADSDVNLSGRLRNPGPNTTEIEPHDEEEEPVDEVSDRLRAEHAPEEPDGPSLEEQSESEEVEDVEEVEGEQDLENSLLDALDSEADESASGDSSASRDTDSGIADPESSPSRGSEREGDGTSPGTGGSSASSSVDTSDKEGNEAADEQESRSRERTKKRARRGDPDRSSNAEEAGQVCGECDSISPLGMRFCVQCGASLRDDEADNDNVGAPALDREKLDGEVGPGFALVSINDDGTDGTSIAIKSSETIIGREGDTRFPTDEFLDPKHTRLTVEDGDLHLEDLNSLNGTYIKLHDEVRLRPGDTFLMGRQVLRFERIDQDLDSEKTADDGTRYMGSPAPGGDYKILQIGVGELVQNIYCLPESGVVLGREKGDIIFPRDKFMSGRHARIFTEDEPYLVDLNSSNGTWIKIWEKRRLDEDDYIFMGQQLFRVELPE